MSAVVRIPAAHRSPVRAVAGTSTPDGRGLILTAGGDDLIRSWDATSGVAGSFQVPYPSVPVTFLGVIGARLLVCADNTAIRRFDLATGAEVGERLRPPGAEWLPTGGLGPVATVGGLLVAGGAGGKLHRWDAATGERVGAAWTAHTGKVLALTALRTRDGRAVVVSAGEDGLVRRWDATTGEPIGSPLAGPQRPVIGLAGAPDADLLVAQEWKGPIHRWDATTGEPAGPPMRRAGLGLVEGGLAVTPDGRALLSADQAGVPWRWDLTRDEPSAEPLPVPETMATRAAVVPSAQGWLFVTGGENGRLRRWAADGRPAGDELPGHSTSVVGLVALPAAPGSGGPAVLVSSGRDGVRAWDATTGKPVGAATGPLPAGDGLAAAWLPDGRLMVASGTDEGLLRGDLSTGTVDQPTGDDQDHYGMTAVAAGQLPDGRRFFAGTSAQGAVNLIDAQTGESLREPLRGLPSQVFAVAVTTLPDGTVLVAAGGEDRRILRWNAVTGERIGEPLTVGEWWVMRLAFHAPAAGRPLLSSVDDDGVVRRWDAVTGEPAGGPLSAGGALGPVLRLEDVIPGETIAVGRDDVLRCWDVVTGRHLGDVPQAACAAAVTAPAAFAIGHLDGSITITSR